jgi:hypothetical protein
VGGKGKEIEGRGRGWRSMGKRGGKGEGRGGEGRGMACIGPPPLFQILDTPLTARYAAGAALHLCFEPVVVCLLF